MKTSTIFLCLTFVFCAAETEWDNNGGYHFSINNLKTLPDLEPAATTEPTPEIKKDDLAPKSEPTETALEAKPAGLNYFNRHPLEYPLWNHHLLNREYDSRYGYPFYPGYGMYNPLYLPHQQYPVYQRPLYSPYHDSYPYYAYPPRDHVPFSYRYRQISQL